MKCVMELCDAIREIAYAIHLYHGHGHLEQGDCTINQVPTRTCSR